MALNGCTCHMPYAGMYPPVCAVHGPMPRMQPYWGDPPDTIRHGRAIPNDPRLIPPPRDGKGYTLRKVKEQLDNNWMRVGPNTDAAIWRPWGRETGEL